uniref:Uncharacterized protein n=1 Tax=Anguilla anguilla TaxID=7936 RepID=A0A0E9PPG4_ANGAN
MLHSWDGVLQIKKPHPFPPYLALIIMAKQFKFCFI